MRSDSASKLTLEDVVAHFAAWRRQKKARTERIPEGLWSEAVGLVGEYSVAQVARRLRLLSRVLKERHDAAVERMQGRAGGGMMEFMEVTPRVTSWVARPTTGRLRVELERPDGMRLRLESGSGEDLWRVVERFMEGRPCCS